MSKKLILLFLVIIFVGLEFPFLSLASGIYTACPKDYPIIGREDGKCYSASGSHQDPKEIYYEGLVPCGKEVCVAKETSLNKKDIDDDINGEYIQAEPGGPYEFSKKSFEDACESNNGCIVQINCQLCHTFVMAKGIVDFFLIYIIPPLAVLLITIGGIMFYFGGANPSYVSKGITLMKTVAIGLFLIYGAFMLVGMFLGSLGAAEWTGLTEGGWYRIKCAIRLP